MKRSKKHFKVVVITLLIAVLTSTFAIPSASAANKTTTTRELFAVWYTGYLYWITVYNYFSADYTTTALNGTNLRFNVSPQNLGGVIDNALRPGYYPFSQSICAAYVYLYKDGSYADTFSFVWDPDPSIVEPYDQPYGYTYSPLVYLYNWDYNELRPFISMEWKWNNSKYRAAPNDINLLLTSIDPYHNA